MTTRRNSTITTILLWAMILLLDTPPTHGFASWLRCYVELETDEVVMNHYIQPSSKAQHEIPIQIRAKDDEAWSKTPPKTIGNTLEIKLDFPDEYIQQDVQWVMEVTPEGAAEFVGNGRMCDGTRAHSKNDEVVTLQIKDATVPIKLVGGYAAGHEAVILTQPMHLGKSDKPTENGTTKEL